MPATSLFLDLHSTDHTRHHAALVSQDEQLLAEHDFDYRLDTIAILTKLETFDPTKSNPYLRKKRI